MTPRADPEMALAVEELQRTGAGFVIVKDQRVVAVGKDHGVADLIAAGDRLRRGGLLGAVLADRIVGRAALLVACWSGIRALHAGLISDAALEEASARHLAASYDARVPRILNRHRSESCPFERASDEAAAGGLSLDGIVKRLRATAGALRQRADELNGRSPA